MMLASAHVTTFRYQCDCLGLDATITPQLPAIPRPCGCSSGSNHFVKEGLTNGESGLALHLTQILPFMTADPMTDIH